MSHKSLERLLAEHGRGPSLSFHMPGHKGRALHTPALPWQLDITEIHGFDDLHDPCGVLADGMARAAALWGSKEARYLINGSSGGILAALHAVLPRSSSLLVARNCHRSVYHALELLELAPIFLQPEIDPAFGVAGSLSVSATADVLDGHPEVRALMLVSPTYDGVISDITGLCTLCHSRGIPVIVDEAHGAHLSFPPFPKGAVAAGADLVIQSVHKTLPSLTQTALLHRQGDLVDPIRLARSLSLFQSSSPSYPLMAAIDGCVQLLEEQGRTLFPDWMEALTAFDRRISTLERLRILCHGRDGLDGHPTFFGYDPSKLVISTRGTTLTGPALMDQLRESADLELEMAAPGYATAMTGLGTTAGDLTALADSLLALDSQLAAAPAEHLCPAAPIPRYILPAGQALDREAEVLPLEQAAGRIAAEYLWAYPPGIPLIVPGEEISPDLPPLCSRYEAAGIHLKHTSHTPSGRITVCR